MDHVTVRTPPRQSAKIGQAAATRALAAAIVPASSRATLVSRIGKICRSGPGDEREIAAGWVDDAVMGASLDLTICKGRMATGVPFDFRIRIVGADARGKSSASTPCLSDKRIAPDQTRYISQDFLAIGGAPAGADGAQQESLTSAQWT
jgi:hypothetical protein